MDQDEEFTPTERIAWRVLRNPWLAALGCALLVSLFYLPSVRFDFVWDDILFLVNSPDYRLATDPFAAAFHFFPISPNYFRPLVVLSFLSDLRLWGLDPAPYHVENVLLHALNAALVVFLAQRFWTGRPWVGWLAGLGYSLHPALIESVAFISSRFDLMATTFLLLALLVERSAPARSWLRPFGVALAFLLAAGAKEMAAAFGLALPFWHLALDTRTAIDTPGETSESWGNRLRRLVQQHWPVYAALFAAGVFYLLVRFRSLGYLFVYIPGTPDPGPFIPHLLLVGRSYLQYLILMVWPFTSLTPVHYTPRPLAGNFLDWLVLLGFLATLVGAGYLSWRRRPSGVLLLAGFVALLPVSNVQPLELSAGALVAERYLTFPLLFFVLAAVDELSRLRLSDDSRAQHLALVLPASWLLACAFAINLILPNWHNEVTLWRWITHKAPQSAQAWSNLSSALSKSGDPTGSLAAANTAVSLDPDTANAHNNAGLALLNMGRYQEAEVAFRNALQINPNDLLYWNNLAGALREQGRLEEAVQILFERVLAQGEYPAARLNLGLLYLRADRPDLARQHLEISAQLLAPDDAAAARELLNQTLDPARWLRLGQLLAANGDPQGAEAAYQEAVRLGADPGQIPTPTPAPIPGP